MEYIVRTGNEAVCSSLAKWRVHVECTVRAAVSLEIKGGKELFFHALTFVWEVCTLVPCLLHALGERSFISVQIKSSLTALVIVRS